MMARRVMLSVIAGGAAAALIGCGVFDRRSSYRFRMTVEADTPQGVRRGSGVLQVNAVKTVALTAHEHAGGAGVTGEAVVLNMPDGPVFVLLDIGDGKPSLAVQVTRALDPRVDRLDAGQFVDAVSRLGKSPSTIRAELPRADWPIMVRFRNFNDPKSVEKVTAEAFQISRITIETTDAPVTADIESRMPSWFNELIKRRAKFSGAPSGIVRSDADLAGILGPGDFGTEIGK